jgi:polar amino acid transport system permease protein
VFRSGIEALHKGQREAAISLGMTPSQSMVYIIMPQAVRIVLPPVGNYAIGLLKDTSLCSLIGVNELMNDAKSIAFADYQPMAVFVLVAAIYFVFSYPLSLAVRYMEWRLNVSR